MGEAKFFKSIRLSILSVVVIGGLAFAQQAYAAQIQVLGAPGTYWGASSDCGTSCPDTQINPPPMVNGGVISYNQTWEFYTISGSSWIGSGAIKESDLTYTWYRGVSGSKGITWTKSVSAKGTPGKSYTLSATDNNKLLGVCVAASTTSYKTLDTFKPDNSASSRTNCSSYIAYGGAPSVASIKPISKQWTTQSPTSARYLVQFSEIVRGVDSSDFTNAGTATGCKFHVANRYNNFQYHNASEHTSYPGDEDYPISQNDPNYPVPADTATFPYFDPEDPNYDQDMADAAMTVSVPAGYDNVTDSGGRAVWLQADDCNPDGTLIVRLKSGSIQDIGGAAGPAANADSSPINMTQSAPTVTWSTVPASPTKAGTATSKLTYVATLSNPFDVASGSGISITNTGTATGCSISAPVFTDSTHATVTVSSCSEGTVVLSWPKNSFYDQIGNLGPASETTSSAVTIDRTGPSLTSLTTATSSPTNASSLSFTLVANEPITGLSAADFKNSGTAKGCVFAPAAASGNNITITVTGCGDGTVIPTLVKGSVTDSLGNIGPATNSPGSSIAVDKTAPTATWTNPASPSKLKTLTYTLKFSETVTGLTSSDFTVSGVTGWSVASVSGSGTTYTVTVSTSGVLTGSLFVQLAANGVTDGAGNLGPKVAAKTAAVAIIK